MRSICYCCCVCCSSTYHCRLDQQNSLQFSELYGHRKRLDHTELYFCQPLLIWSHSIRSDTFNVWEFRSDTLRDIMFIQNFMTHRHLFVSIILVSEFVTGCEEGGTRKLLIVYRSKNTFRCELLKIHRKITYQTRM